MTPIIVLLAIVVTGLLARVIVRVVIWTARLIWDAWDSFCQTFR